MRIDTIKTDCAPPSTHRRVILDIEVESTLGEKTDVPVDPLSSRGISQFHLKIDFHLESDLEAVKVFQCLSKLLRSSASYESRKTIQSNLNNISDVTNSDITDQPMLLNWRTCVANEYDEQLKDPVIDDARKTDQQSVAISRSTEGRSPLERTRRNDREPPRIYCALFKEKRTEPL